MLRHWGQTLVWVRPAESRCCCAGIQSRFWAGIVVALHWCEALPHVRIEEIRPAAAHHGPATPSRTGPGQGRRPAGRGLGWRRPLPDRPNGGVTRPSRLSHHCARPPPDHPRRSRHAGNPLLRSCNPESHDRQLLRHGGRLPSLPLDSGVGSGVPMCRQAPREAEAGAGASADSTPTRRGARARYAAPGGTGPWPGSVQAGRGWETSRSRRGSAGGLQE